MRSCRVGRQAGRVSLPGPSGAAGSASRERHQLIFSEADKRGSGRPGRAEPGWSGPGAEEEDNDSLLYPLAVGGHFIQGALHADAHVLDGVKLVHEALSLRVLQRDR